MGVTPQNTDDDVTLEIISRVSIPHPTMSGARVVGYVVAASESDPYGFDPLWKLTRRDDEIERLRAENERLSQLLILANASPATA